MFGFLKLSFDDLLRLCISFNVSFVKLDLKLILDEDKIFFLLFLLIQNNIQQL